MAREQYLNCTDPFKVNFFSINSVNVFSLPHDFLNISFSLAYFILLIQCLIRVTYKICQSTVHAIGKAASQKLSVKFRGNQKSQVGL